MCICECSAFVHMLSVIVPVKVCFCGAAIAAVARMVSAKLLRTTAFITKRIGSLRREGMVGWRLSSSGTDRGILRQWGTGLLATPVPRAAVEAGAARLPGLYGFE